MIFFKVLLEDNEEEEAFEVEKILEKRVIKKKVEYLIKWKNYNGPDDDTWEPADILEGAGDIIKKFEKELKIEKENEKTKLSKVIENSDEKQTKTEIVENTEKVKGKIEEDQKAEHSEAKKEKSSTKNESAPLQEDVYNVEALMEKKGSKYLVKWENYPEDQNSWEPKSSIPDSILKVNKEDNFSISNLLNQSSTMKRTYHDLESRSLQTLHR